MVVITYARRLIWLGHRWLLVRSAMTIKKWTTNCNINKLIRRSFNWFTSEIFPKPVFFLYKDQQDVIVRTLRQQIDQHFLNVNQSFHLQTSPNNSGRKPCQHSEEVPLFAAHRRDIEFGTLVTWNYSLLLKQIDIYLLFWSVCSTNFT